MHIDIYSKVAAKTVSKARERIVTQCRRVGVTVTFSPARPHAGERRVALVFAGPGGKWSTAEEKSLQALLKRGAIMMPVVLDPKAAQFLPKSLSHLNAFVMDFFKEAWADCLADEILSRVWLHRRTPKVFISYKRIDSAPIAGQLYDRLNHLGYETFLDEATMPRAVDFQRELKWWLNNADLLIVLASPRFPQSRWCMEEVSFCQQRFIGVAVVQWPQAIYEGPRRIPFPGVGAGWRQPEIIRRAQSAQKLTLLPEDFAGAPIRRNANPKLPERELTPEGLGKILTLCATQRTVGIRQRLNNLIPLARHLLRATPVAGAFNPADLACVNAGSTQSFVRVLPFRPRPENIRQACVDGVAYGRLAGCFYAENDPRDPRAQALLWLANGKRKPNKKLSDGWLWASVGARLL
jgi:hypothetical protein